MANGNQEELTCDFIAGCDGFHGIRHPAIEKAVSCYDKMLSVRLAGHSRGSPAVFSESLVYTYVAVCAALLYSACVPPEKITRLYFQVPPDEDIDQWSDDAIWEEMLKRMSAHDEWRPNVGPILNKGVTAMRSFVTEPMSAGRLYLAGNAAHIVPPTGAKGLNLAAFDVLRLGPGDRQVLRHRQIGSAPAILRHGSEARMAGAAFLMVHDSDAAPVPRWKSV